MDRLLRDDVRNRAGNRCEYCRLRQEHYRLWRHQTEHILPRKHGGSDDQQNLALACIGCNLCKSSNLSGIDELTGDLVPLFNPRTEDWFAHFSFKAHISSASPRPGEQP